MKTDLLLIWLDNIDYKDLVKHGNDMVENGKNMVKNAENG
jgi:hypothetical protein